MRLTSEARNSSKYTGWRRVQTPLGPRKSGMPLPVEMPAPVNTRMRRERPRRSTRVMRGSYGILLAMACLGCSSANPDAGGDGGMADGGACGAGITPTAGVVVTDKGAD